MLKRPGAGAPDPMKDAMRRLRAQEKEQLWRRARVFLCSRGVRATVFLSYRNFLLKADADRRKMRAAGGRYDDIILYLRGLVEHTATRQGLDRVILRDLLYNVLTIRV